MELGTHGREYSARGRFATFVLFFTLLFVILEARLFYLQIVHGRDYRERARISVISKERIPARRGLLLDRKGQVIAKNQPVFRVKLTPHYLERGAKNETLSWLADLMRWTHEERAAVELRIQEAIDGDARWEPMTLPGELIGDRCPGQDEALQLAERPERYAFCRESGETLVLVDKRAKRCRGGEGRIVWNDEARLSGKCSKSGRKVVISPRCEGQSEPDDFLLASHNLICPSTKRHHTNQVAALESRLHELSGLELKTEFRRAYPFNYDAAHLIGYMNRVTAEDREEHEGIYGLHDRVGRTGIERAFEETLRGKPGQALYVKDSQGQKRRPRDTEGVLGQRAFVPSTSGDDLWLTIDMDLQREVRRAFRYHKSGAGVVVDPRNGEVLALYSKPGFDPNAWARGLSHTEWEEIKSNPYTPLINKALTPYAPGSVYKIVASVEAIETGIMTPETTIECPGHYEYGGRRFHCHNREGHGFVDLVNAIKHSCDVYFYRVGEMLGMQSLADRGSYFGFGHNTGVEVPERVGRVPTKQWHSEQTMLGWQPGFTLSTAIGQGSLTASPIQVARAYVALANGGHLLDLTVVKKRKTPDGQVTETPTPLIHRHMDIDLETLGLVREGLVRVVNDAEGSAYDSALETMVTAGKTGTAEAA